MIPAALMILGAFLALASAIGLVRFPDVFCRSHALGVGATLGLLLLLAGVASAIGSPDAWAKCGLAAIFVFLTAPVGSHMLSRAAYLYGRSEANLIRDDLQASRTEMEDHPSS